MEDRGLQRREYSASSVLSAVSLGRPSEAGGEANGLGAPTSPSKLSDELARRLAVADSNPAQPQVTWFRYCFTDDLPANALDCMQHVMTALHAMQTFCASAAGPVAAAEARTAARPSKLLPAADAPTGSSS